MDTPTEETAIRLWIAWAFVPAKRPYPHSTYCLKHEVEHTWSSLYVRERDFIRGMLEAGFRPTKDGHYFYVADSPSRKTFEYESQLHSYGSVPHPLHRLDATTEFGKLPSAERQRLLGWIGEHLCPTKRGKLPAFLPWHLCCGPESEDTIRAFCGAMVTAGYQPINPEAYHSDFRAAVKHQRRRLRA
jgi:hypothetical protein